MNAISTLYYTDHDSGRPKDLSALVALYSRCPEFIRLTQTWGADWNSLTFTQQSQAIKAFLHSSFVNESGQLKLESNERLELLGDAVLDLVVTDFILQAYPSLSEGNCSKLRASLVNRTQLALLAEQSGMQECILMGKGETKAQRYRGAGPLADAFESWIGAIYRIHGPKLAMQTLKDYLQKTVMPDTGLAFFALEHLQDFDFKTKLQEFFMAEFQTIPRYEFQAQESLIVAKLYLGQQFLAQETGPSKKQAGHQLAKKIWNTRKDLLINPTGNLTC